MPRIPSTSRDSSIDIAKGFAIVAIVFGHVWLGLEAAGLIQDLHTFNVVYDTVYMSHLSVFAFTAGLFV
ncbi:heparan-alpha-glucosaminide N-acetyltransferase domain-containing protein [Pseudoclavibacter helvolus]